MTYRHIGTKALAFSAAVGTAIALNLVTLYSPAIAQDTCLNADYIPASATMRTVQLPQFGVQISIPENFRTMARQDGSISILSPHEFNHIQCLNQGIPVLGTELESEDLRLIDNPGGRSAMEYAREVAPQNYPAWAVASDTICIQTIDGVELVIREVFGAYDIAYAWYRPKGTQSLVEISAFTKADLLDLLSRTQFVGTTFD